MMKDVIVNIKIVCDNAAFHDNPNEVSRILHELAGILTDNDLEDKNLRDINGNKVGTFEAVTFD